MTNDKFPASSRYRDVDVATLSTAEGRRIAYLRRRFVPPSESFSLLREHVVRAGERLDQVAATEIGDPEHFWRVADANGAMAPEELTDAPGRRLRITLPAGIPGGEEG